MSNLILLIDDDESLRRVTEYNLSSAGFRVITAASGVEGLKLFEQKSPDLVVTDVQLGDITGLEVLDKVKEMAPEIPVIVITAFGTIEMAVKAMSNDAFNFITKPFDRDTLRTSCRKALELRNLRSRTEALTNEVNRLAGTEGMISANSAMAELLDTAMLAANSEATILITGESGTGKEVMARLIHQNSPRKNGPMVSLNCSAIPETLIESELFGHKKGSFTGATANRKGHFIAASQGTIFLDEIGDLKMDLQVKLLRAIQEREIVPVGANEPEPIDVRIIAATNKDLQKAIAEKKFREDLYYRLGVILLHLPPLRERKEDIAALVPHFLKKLNLPEGVSFSAAALARMKDYDWPGNIRELQNVVERSTIFRRGKLIEESVLNISFAMPESNKEKKASLIPDIPDEGISLEEVEKTLIIKALEKAGNNRSKAAKLLRIPRHVLLYRLEKFDLK